jgi:hypothetical protein
MRSTPRLNDRLHRAAVTTLADAEGELLQSLTRPSVEFVFGQRRDVQGQTQLRSRLVAAITGATPDRPITSLVVATKLVADILGPTDLEPVRQRLASATIDEQAPIFEDPPSRLLAQGAVVGAMFESLGAWTPTAAGQEQTLIRAERLIALSGTGWDGQEQLTALAMKLMPQVTELTAAPEVLASLDALARLFSGAEVAAEFDQFGSQLAARRTVGGQELFRYALLLPLQATALASVGTEIQTWMLTAAPQQIEPLLSIARAQVAEALPTYGQVLLGLWESKGDAEFATLAVGGDPTRLGDLHSKWDALPTGSALQQAVPALDLTSAVGDRSAVEGLIGRIASRVAAIPFAHFSPLPFTVDWLVKHRYTRQTLVEALEAKVQSAATATDLHAISPHVIQAADVFGGRQRAGLAETVADGFVALNIGEPDEVAWIVERLTAHNTQERLVVQLIERGLSQRPTLDAVSRARAHLDSVQVFEALVQRASREDQEANAKIDLDAAEAWSRPAPDAGSDARASLDALAEKFPSLREQGDRLVPPMTAEG